MLSINVGVFDSKILFRGSSFRARRYWRSALAFHCKYFADFDLVLAAVGISHVSGNGVYLYLPRVYTRAVSATLGWGWGWHVSLDATSLTEINISWARRVVLEIYLLKPCGFRLLRALIAWPYFVFKHSPWWTFLETSYITYLLLLKVGTFQS